MPETDISPLFLMIYLRELAEEEGSHFFQAAAPGEEFMCGVVRHV